MSILFECLFRMVSKLLYQTSGGIYSPHQKSYHMIRLSFDDKSLFIRVLFFIIWYIVPVQSNSHADANIFRLQE